MNTNKLAFAAAAAGAALFGAIAPSAHAAVIDPGTYAILNHRDGDPVPFGLRLDELYNVAPYADIFLFDFEHNDAFMVMTVTASTIHIYGDAWGGRWFQTGLVNDQYQGLYSIDFLFNTGVQSAPGDDDYIVNGPNNANHGSILTPLGDTIALWDERGGNAFSFRLGDEDNDLGHRGMPGPSGWGWVNHGNDPAHHTAVGDWLFTVGEPIPSPGPAVTMLAGLALLATRRRR